MKIFERDGKTNFVDDNNVFVGFCSYQNCCENFGWFIDKVAPTTWETDHHKPDPRPEELANYSFDTSYFKEISGDNTYDEDNMAIFRLVNSNQDECFLVLYNSHNGYYSHGFEMRVNDLIHQSGTL